VGPTSVTVAWTAPTNGAASYEVERAFASTGPWAQVVAGLTTPGWTDSTVSPNTGYWYRVRARNLAGVAGSYSAARSVTTAVDPGTVPPGAAGTPTYSSIAATTLTVSWAAATGATSYALERAPDSSGAPGTWTRVATGVAATTHGDTGRTANTRYWYRVRASNAGGDAAFSTSSGVMTAPSAPGAPTFTGITASSVTLAWTAPSRGAASYVLERGATSSGPWIAVQSGYTALSYTDTGLSAATRYYYRVKATNADGTNGAASSARNVTTSAATPGA
jgi:titin